jgi:tetratricopeptide (TPR) repeat protein
LNPTIVLSLLLLTDCLDLHASARAPKPEAPSPEKLRPHRRVSPAQMKATRPVLAKRKPSSVRPPAPVDLEQTRTVAARLKQASEAKKSLPPPRPGGPNDAPTTPPPSAVPPGELAPWGSEAAPSTPMAPVNRILAEKAFQAGKAFVRANNMKDAAVELQRAATLFPAIEYELWASWTSMRADKAGESTHAAAVRALAEKAIEQDPSLGFAYFVLGHLALRSFDAARARELFAKARALDPATTSEAKDVRLKNAAKDEAVAPPAGADAAASTSDARADAGEPSPELAQVEEQGPNTRPSLTEPGGAPASSSSAEAPAVESDARASSRGAAMPTPRRRMLIALAAAAAIAILLMIAARKSEGPPKASVNASPASASASAPAPPPPSASAAPNAISLDDDEDASRASDAASAPDTKRDASTFPPAASPSTNDE